MNDMRRSSSGSSEYSEAWLWQFTERSTSFWESLTAAQMFVGSFMLLILLGTVGFKTLPGLYTGEPLTWLNALFTATSAVCVTGLIVVDTATYFTTAGQAYILLLIQLGGLGIITFATIIFVGLGERLSLRHESLMRGTADIVPHVDYRQLTLSVFRFTFVIEAVGALLLYVFWVPDFGWAGAIWPSIFQSVSAFCNAGFSTFTTSLMQFQQSPGVLVTIMLLVVVGGIGFLTLEELFMWRKARSSKQRFRMSLHSLIVLATTTVLILGGWMLVLLFEWNMTLEEMPLWAKLMNGLFASITPRTAGFNTIDYAQTANSTNFLTIILMAIGGSPGSTAGGLKTTTAALLGLVALRRLQGHEVTSVIGRSIPPDTIRRALGLFVIAFGIMTLGIFIFTSSEIASDVATRIRGAFLKHMFEAVSAFNTVGLSMGVTGNLSIVGRWVTIFLMFVGRVGPLSFAAALSRQAHRTPTRFRYAYEDVTIG